jgi:urease accessory protein
MVVGGAVAIAGLSIPAVEPGILASVVVLGLLVLVAAQLPVLFGAGLIALFALLHGHAHGAELPAQATAGSYAAGFALATALLHGFGLGVAYLAGNGRGRLLVRGAGAMVAIAGVALTLG